MYKHILIICLSLVYCLGNWLGGGDKFKLFKTLYFWNQTVFDFDGVQYTKDMAKEWNSDAIYFEEDLQEKDMFFKQHNNVPAGFDVYKKRLFITIPRRRYGVPSTLNYVTIQTKTFSPPLKPYPTVDSVSSFVSVYRPRVDVCGRLWVVDTGLLEVPDNHVQVKPPEIIIFDLETDIEILRHQLKSSVLSNGTTFGLGSIIVDVTKLTCDNAYAYINDWATGGLIVFSLRDRDSWRFTHPTFAHNVDETIPKFLAKQLQSPAAGIFSIALSDPDSNGTRTAYYHAFSAIKEFSITTDVLKNRTSDFDKHFKLEGDRGDMSQCGAHVYHSGTRTLIFANFARNTILCWNVDRPMTADNMYALAVHVKWLNYITDLRIVYDNLVLMINHKPRFAYTSPMEPNFMLWAKVTSLINGTGCMEKNTLNKQ